MYALVINKEVLIFDFNRYYGIHKEEDCNLEGFLKVITYKELIDYCCLNNIVDASVIEPYLEFLHCLCLKYLRDCY